MAEYKLGVLGCGNMGGAIIRSVVNNSVFSAEEVLIFDIIDEKMKKISEETGTKCAKNEISLVRDSEIVLIAVKPQYLADLLHLIKKSLINNTEKTLFEEIKRKIFVSIAAGVKISFIENLLGKNLKIVRVMPNLMAVVGESASALSFNAQINENDKKSIKNIFKAFGIAVEMDEKFMDTVTGLSGSGPAYVAVFIEALADGAVKMGLPRDKAYLLAAQTVKGTAKFLLQKGLHPAVLKDMVSSPGGTTIHAIHELEKNGFRNAVISAVEAASKRSAELGRK